MATLTLVLPVLDPAAPTARTAEAVHRVLGGDVVVVGAGGRTQVAQLFSAAAVALVLLFFTGPLAYLPEAALAAVVFHIGTELVDLRGLRQVWHARRAEFWVALITAATVVVRGVDQGIVLAMVLSLLLHTRHGYKPKNRVVARDDRGRWTFLPLDAARPLAPGLVVYGFTHSLYYANAGRFAQEVLSLARTTPPGIRCLCIEASAIDDVDFTGAQVLLEVIRQLRADGIRLVFAMVAPDVMDELDRSGVVDELGRGAFYDSLDEVVDQVAVSP